MSHQHLSESVQANMFLFLFFSTHRFFLLFFSHTAAHSLLKHEGVYTKRLFQELSLTTSLLLSLRFFYFSSYSF